jgi:hypothetical protein
LISICLCLGSCHVEEYFYISKLFFNNFQKQSAMSTIEKNLVRVGKFVDNDHVDTVVKTYKQERWVYNSERLGMADSLSGWYSIEELEDYIALIKEHGADGIRFYFGAYPKNYTEVPEYAGRQTLVLVATKNRDNGSKRGNKDLYIQDGDDAKLLAYNLIDLCPPFCTGGGTLNPGGSTPPPPPPTNKPEIGVTLIDMGDKGMSVI